MHEIKEIKIGEYFDFKKGTNKYNKKTINKNPGIYPVYSGQTENEGVIGKTKEYEYDGKFIRICTVGNAGNVDLVEGKFALAQNNGILVPINKEDACRIHLKYVMYSIKNILPGLAKGENNGNKQKSLLKADILNVKISIPIDENEKFDIKSQIEISEKYEKIISTKRILNEKKQKIKEINISFENDIKMKYIKIEDLFDVSLGSGKYTKSFCIKNPGIYPVYSGNTVCKFADINEYMYDGQYLTWAKDGLAGYIMYNTGKFSITNHRGILLLKDNYQNIDLEYIKVVLEPIFRNNIKGRLGLEEKNEYTTLSKDMVKNIKEKIPIPIDEKGNFDIQKQKEISKKYRKIKEIKEKLVLEIDNLINTNISIE